MLIGFEYTFLTIGFQKDITLFVVIAAILTTDR
jgi:hypothetical protein